MAVAGCINAYDCEGCYLTTFENLQSDNIGVCINYTAPSEYGRRQLDYIKYTDKCGCTCCLTGENELKICATQGVIKNFTLTNDEDNEVVNVKWGDIFGSNWAYTMVRYKTGSYPTSITDGTLAVKETTKNQYASSGYNVSGLTDGTTYYFTAFAVSQDGTIIVVQNKTIKTDFLFAGYQRVEYVESDGNSCILNTGIVPNNSSYFRVAFKMMPTALKSSGNYFYGCNSSGNYWNSFEYTSSNGSYWNVGYSTLIGTLSPNLTTGTDYEFDCQYNGNNGGTLTVSGTYSRSVSYSRYLGNGNFCFFCAGPDGASQSKERLYYMKIYTGNSTNIVRDFYPVYRKSDNVIGFFDIVNKVFYANAGSGTYTKGPDIN